jgi:hypothetical protein
MNKKIKLLAIAFMAGAIALGTQSCSKDDDSDIKPGDVKVTEVRVTSETKTLLPGGTVTLVLTVLPATATDKRVTWESSNTVTATVVNGVVTAGAVVGEATITATSVANPEKKGTCVITVSDTTISLSAETLTVLMGATETLVATLNPPDASKVINWISSDNAKATVENGRVTGVAEGSVTITAALESNPTIKAECVVTVEYTHPSLVGYWKFENIEDLEKATFGEDLTFSENSDFASIEGPGGTKAVGYTQGYIEVHHNIDANGGGDSTNIYTLMMDIRGPQEWISVFNSDGPGDLWIADDGAIGDADLFSENSGYSEFKLTPDTWYRVVIAANLEEESFKVYIDGALVFTADKNSSVDGIVSLKPNDVYIGYDSDGYRGPDFAEVRVWSIQLTDAQVEALGAPPAQE